MHPLNDLFKHECEVCHEKFRIKQNYITHLKRKHNITRKWRLDI
jgi:hypothetical protein